MADLDTSPKRLALVAAAALVILLCGWMVYSTSRAYTPDTMVPTVGSVASAGPAAKAVVSVTGAPPRVPAAAVPPKGKLGR